MGAPLISFLACAWAERRVKCVRGCESEARERRDVCVSERVVKGVRRCGMRE